MRIDFSSILTIFFATIAGVCAFWAYQLAGTVNAKELERRIDRLDERIQTIEASDTSVRLETSYTLSKAKCSGEWQYIGPNDAGRHGGFCVRALLE